MPPDSESGSHIPPSGSGSDIPPNGWTPCRCFCQNLPSTTLTGSRPSSPWISTTQPSFSEVMQANANKPGSSIPGVHANQMEAASIYGVPCDIWHSLTDEERAIVKTSKRRDEAYKTALCNTFKLTGSCVYADHCRFAHGEHELRLSAQSHPKYKTQLCNKFSVSGVCPYGSRCQFIHRRLVTTPRPEKVLLENSVLEEDEDRDSTYRIPRVPLEPFQSSLNISRSRTQSASGTNPFAASHSEGSWTSGLPLVGLRRHYTQRRFTTPRPETVTSSPVPSFIFPPIGADPATDTSNVFTNSMGSVLHPAFQNLSLTSTTDFPAPPYPRSQRNSLYG